MTRRMPALAALALALGVAAAASGPAMAQDSRMEKRADRMTRTFERLDKNGDGAVDRSELERKQERAFQRLDANNDGVIDRSEIEAIKAKRARKGKGKGGEKMAKRFQRADENRDGKVTQQEFMSMTPRWFDKADENRDGKVTKAELEMWLDRKGSRKKRD